MYAVNIVAYKLKTRTPVYTNFILKVFFHILGCALNKIPNKLRKILSRRRTSLKAKKPAVSSRPVQNGSIRERRKHPPRNPSKSIRNHRRSSPPRVPAEQLHLPAALRGILRPDRDPAQTRLLGALPNNRQRAGKRKMRGVRRGRGPTRTVRLREPAAQKHRGSAAGLPARREKSEPRGAVRDPGANPAPGVLDREQF